jgi:hypothetical protein
MRFAFVRTRVSSLRMSELNDLYQETILEHNKNPRDFS